MSSFGMRSGGDGAKSPGGAKVPGGRKDRGARLSGRGGALVLKSVSLFLAKKAKQNQAENSVRAILEIMAEHPNNAGKYTAKLLEALRKDTHFTKEEIEALYKIYKKLVASSKENLMYMNNIGHASNITKNNKSQEGIDRMVFQELMHNTFDLVIEDSLMDRIFCAWDKNNEGVLKADTWIGGLSVFLRGTFEEKIQYCFRVYDLNSDGFISKDEMIQLLKDSLVKQPQEEDPEEGVKDLVEIVLRKLDIDKDGKVSLADFTKAVNDEPLLLEGFGKCLPTVGSCKTFLATLQQ